MLPAYFFFEPVTLLHNFPALIDTFFNRTFPQRDRFFAEQHLLQQIDTKVHQRDIVGPELRHHCLIKVEGFTERCAVDEFTEFVVVVAGHE